MKSVVISVIMRPRFLLWKLTMCVLLTLSFQAKATGSTCPCYGVCSPGVDISADGKKVNVAFNKPANMSSRHGNATMYFSGPSCLAVNGNTSIINVYVPSVSNSIPNCVHSAVDETTNAWWEVDLGQSYTVSSFVIYARFNLPGRMRGAELLVDGLHCYSFTLTEVYPEIISRTCDFPLTGRLIRYQKTADFPNLSRPNDYYYFVNFCEIQIWVCRPGVYGESCDNTCSWGCLNNQTCDNYYGTCTNGCADGYYGNVGYYGNKCEWRCGQCAGDAACDKTSGHCPAGCRVPGIQPPLCQQLCRNDKWGMNCAMDCGQCRNSAACNAFNGSCGQCADHFQLPLCTGCQDGYYGNTCLETCGFCLNNEACHKSNGRCPNGCQAGYQSPLCKQECEDKTWGISCAMKCGECKNSAACDIFNGSCEQCENQLQPPLCTECPEGKYGEKCSKSCGRCRSGACDRQGDCSDDGCLEGYEGLRCDVKQDDSSNVGVIVGSVIGAAVFLAIVITAGICWHKRSVKHEQSNTVQFSTGNAPNPANQDSRPQKLSNEPSKQVVATEEDEYVNVYNQIPSIYDRAQPFSSDDRNSQVYVQ